jgi:hypothetical protein
MSSHRQYNVSASDAKNDRLRKIQMNNVARYVISSRNEYDRDVVDQSLWFDEIEKINQSFSFKNSCRVLRSKKNSIKQLRFSCRSEIDFAEL